MLVQLNVALRNLILDCMFNTGTPAAVFDGGTARFRSGASPGADAVDTGTVIATVALSADAMAAASAGAVSKNSATWQDTAADAAGTMAHARFTSADGLKWITFDVTASGGGGAITVDQVTLVQNQPFTVTGMTITMPAQ